MNAPRPTLTELIFSGQPSNVQALSALLNLSPVVRQYTREMFMVAEATGVSPAVLSGIMFAETEWGTAAADARSITGPAMTSANGTYLGLMQYNKGLAGDTLEALANGRPKWSVPKYNILRAAQIITAQRAELVTRLKNAGVNVKEMDKNLLGRAILASYNQGPAAVRTAIVQGVPLDNITNKKNGLGYVFRAEAKINDFWTAMEKSEGLV